MVAITVFYYSSLFAGPVANYFGRKLTYIVAAFVAFVFGLAMAFVPNIYAMIVLRIFCGIGIGFVSGVDPMYTAELASDKRRGTIMSLFQVFITVGIMISYIFNLAFCKVNEGWHYELGLITLFNLALGIGSIFCPESALFLQMKNKKKNENSSNTEAGEAEATDSNEQKKEVNISYYFKVWGHYIRGTIVCVVLALAYQLTGLNVLMYYCPTILEGAGITDRVVSLSVTVAIGFWNFLTSLIPFILVDRFGRKILLIIGTFIQGIGMLFVALSYTIDFDKSYALAIPGIIIFLLGFEGGIGPVFFIVINEVFPSSVSALSSTISQFIMWLANIIIILIFQPLADAMTMGGFFFLIMGICLLSSIFCVFVVFETKGIVIPELDQPETKDMAVEEEKKTESDSPALKLEENN